MFDETYTETLQLRDGTAVRLRPIRPEDRERLARAFSRLSPASRERRFLTPKRELSSEELRYLTEPDGDQHFALGATLVGADGEEGEGIGVARFERLKGHPEIAEPAITVTDDYQGRGLGLALGERLVRAASEHGVKTFRFVVTEENEWVRERVRRSCAGARLTTGTSILGLEMPLPEPARGTTASATRRDDWGPPPEGPQLP